MDRPVIAIVGYSNSGKTTIISRLIEEFRERGFRIGVIKHTPHRFDFDHPGKDSYLLKKAGASVSIVSSPSQIAVIMDVDHDQSPDELLRFMEGMDLILLEGFKSHPLPKIEVFRYSKYTLTPLCLNDNGIIAVISDSNVDTDIPVFHPDDITNIAEFIIKYFSLDNHL